MTLHRLRATALAGALVLGAWPLAAQQPTLTPADYAQWETLGITKLSADGRRLAYTVNRVDDDVALHYRSVAGDTLHVVPHAYAPELSRDGRWLAYSQGVSLEERRRREQAGEISRSSLHLVDLQGGLTTDLGEFASASFSPDAAHLAVRGFAGDDGGADLVVRDLGRGTSIHFAGVTASEWRDSGAVLAFITSTADDRGGTVQLFDAHTGVVRSLADDTAPFSGLIWREDHDDVAVLRRITDSTATQPTHAILLWRNASSRSPDALELVPRATPGFPHGRRIVEHRPLRWSDDGAAIFFGTTTASVATADTAAASGDERAQVEVWHSMDVQIIPEQKVQSGLAAIRSDIAVWHIDRDRVIQLGDSTLESVQLSTGRYALGLDSDTHAREAMFGPQLRDLYVIDVATGERRLAVERVQYQYGISPGGRYLLYVRDGDFRTYDVRSGADTNITAAARTSFINSEHDFPVQEKPPFGVAGWTPGDRSVLLHDRYDVWELRTDGSGARRLTNGAPERIRHRRLWLNPEDRVVDLSQPTFVGLYGETTKQTGFARIRADRSAERLLFVDAHASRLSKADAADVYMFRRERFDDSPDLFVGSASLADARQVSHTNRFADRYAWGRAKLLDFESTTGRELQAALFYPADYEPGRRYPLIVDVYETVSSSLHSWVAPSEESMHNTTVFTQNGYFVLKPDIAYRVRDPGVSAVEAIVPAVRRAIATGMIDTTAIGLLGHSWGAYQTAFTVTQTDLFAAAVAAAPLANMISMYLSIYWNTGGTDARMFELDQGRMEVPFWEDVDAYMRNSPVFHIERMDTPLLVAFGNRDGAVDWHQGIELYNAARRAGKPMVLLVYEGENHSLARRANRLDYHRRTNDWLAHYLKREPAADWITRGEPYRGTR